MSANPDAFEFLRKEAYAFVNRNGRDRWRLLDFCNSSILRWLTDQGSELSETEALRISADVTKWTIENYNPPRKKAARRREERAATELAVPVLLEFAAETYGTATVRNAARFGGQSKSTVARHLRQLGISPKRKSKIEKLPPMERRLVSILDETFPRDGAGLVLIDHLAAALWDGRVSSPTEPLPEIARSTKSTRRKKLTTYLATISGYGLGFHIIVASSAVAIRRGRKFHGVKNALLWIEDEKRLHGFRGIVIPEPVENEVVRFWADPWLICVLAVLELGLRSQYLHPSDLEPFVRLTSPVLDTRPLYPWFERAIHSYRSDDFAENLGSLSEKIHDRELRAAVGLIAWQIQRMRAWAQYDNPVRYFHLIDFDLKFMSRLRDIAPESYARCGYLRDVILPEFRTMHEREAELEASFNLGRKPMIVQALEYCRSLGDLEHCGEWVSPTAIALAYYRPENEPPF